MWKLNEKRGKFALVLNRGKFAPKFPAKKNTNKKKGQICPLAKKNDSNTVGGVGYVQYNIMRWGCDSKYQQNGTETQ
jgi:hypothetical protein